MPKWTWDEIEQMLDVNVRTANDAEWDELKLKSIEATIVAIIDRLRREVPDPD